MAAFLLAVFLTRIAAGLACEPHEFAELFGGGGVTIWVTADDDRSDITTTEHAADHCRQCQCHHGLASPSASGAPIPGYSSQAMSLVVAPHADAPAETQLRPPIF